MVGKNGKEGKIDFMKQRKKIRAIGLVCSQWQ